MTEPIWEIRDWLAICNAAYTPTGEFQLSLQAGDKLKVMEEYAGWYKGFQVQNPEEYGIFPSSYVQLFGQNLLALTHQLGKAQEEGKVKWKQRYGERAMAVHTFTPTGPNQIPITKGEELRIMHEHEGWFRGHTVANPSISGIFPKSYVRLQQRRKSRNSRRHKKAPFFSTEERQLHIREGQEQEQDPTEHMHDQQQGENRDRDSSHYERDCDSGERDVYHDDHDDQSVRGSSLSISIAGGSAHTTISASSSSSSASSLLSSKPKDDKNHHNHDHDHDSSVSSSNNSSSSSDVSAGNQKKTKIGVSFGAVSTKEMEEEEEVEGEGGGGGGGGSEPPPYEEEGDWEDAIDASSGARTQLRSAGIDDWLEVRVPSSGVTYYCKLSGEVSWTHPKEKAHQEVAAAEKVHIARRATATSAPSTPNPSPSPKNDVDPNNLDAIPLTRGRSMSSAWETVEDPTTKLCYYHNVITKEVSWTKPGAKRTWVEVLDPKSGSSYWANMETGEVSWTKPQPADDEEGGGES